MRESLGNFMISPPKMTPEDKPQTIEFVPDYYDWQVSDSLLESDAIDATVKPMNQKSITDLLINS